MAISRGKEFEGIIKEAFLAVPNTSVDRLHDQMSGFKVTSKNVSDFIVYHKPQMSKWIPVTEELPENSRCKYILVTLYCPALNFKSVTPAYYINEKFYSLETARSFDDEVIAWMPLPKPYEVKMSDYIEKSKALENLKKLPATLDSETVQRCIETISNMPAVEAIPIEWIWKYWDDGDKPKNYAFHIRDMIEAYKNEREE